MERIDHYKLPASGAHRERLREKGQFWTPDWIADAMCAYVLRDGSPEIFDPAVGAGAFFRAARRLAGKELILRGTEIDPKVLNEARQHGLSDDDLAGVALRDFVFSPTPQSLKAIVANPPYLRHHRISAENKEKLKQLSLQKLGKALDGRAGLHIYFLIQALSSLGQGGRLAFIMPADTCEGKFATDLWRWIGANYCLDAVVTFSPTASPFPNVDTNPLIFLLRNAPPAAHFAWVRCDDPRTEELTHWVRSGFSSDQVGLHIIERELAEGLNTGLSRPPQDGNDSRYVLGDFAAIQRGIATGANEFFFLTRARATALGIPEHYLKRAVGRTRDVPDGEITETTLRTLEAGGTPTWLLSLGKQEEAQLPPAVRRYLLEGEVLGLPKRALISQRRPWYKMETRTPPPFLFSYLGRRNTRFIRNRAGVVPLTGFLCVYPHTQEADFNEKLWAMLSHPDTIANLPRIGKSYGGGAIKVEPRSLERLPIPEHVLAETGLLLQLRLFQPEPAYVLDAAC